MPTENLNFTLSIIAGGAIAGALYPRALLIAWTVTVSVTSIYLHLYQAPLAPATFGVAIYACGLTGLLNELNNFALIKKSQERDAKTDAFLRGWLLGGTGIMVGNTMAALVASKSILAIGKCLLVGAATFVAGVLVMLICNILNSWEPSTKDSTSLAQPAQPLSLSSSTLQYPLLH